MSFVSSKVVMGDLGKVYIPQKMLEKLNIEKGQVLQLTATGNIIVIEKCEVEEE
jgi:bifunctional DNA-binding transcriptional regulator/antitoxin component of YhaV-PrlF toxin-antitoxin module